MQNKLIILGAKGTAKKAIEIVEGQNLYSEIALLDNFAPYDHVMSYPIIGKCDDFEKYVSNFTHAIVCIGDNGVRGFFIRKLIESGLTIPNIIHPRAYISRSASFGTGIFMDALSILQADSKMGDGCMLNSGAVVEHENRLGDFINMGPGAATTGDVKIGNNTFIGANSCIINGVSIGENVVIAAGSSVISDVPDNVMIAGCPAKIKKTI